MIQLWAQRSFQATTAKLDELQAGSGDVLRSDALAAVEGWTEIETEEREAREDITVSWKSILGDYRIRIHATKKSTSKPDQIFTGFVVLGKKPQQVPIPNIENVKLPPDPTVASSGRKQQKKKSRPQTKSRSQAKSRPKKKSTSN